ncbi:MAG: hypothetical protein PHH87_05545 [Desulfuromonas sp.]|nr:hypothetical protein [Desulfuromonas sp.]
MTNGLRERTRHAPYQPYSQAIKFNLVFTLDPRADNTIDVLLREPGAGVFSLWANPLLFEGVCAGVEICIEHTERARTIEAWENSAIVTGDSYVYRF